MLTNMLFFSYFFLAALADDTVPRYRGLRSYFNSNTNNACDDATMDWLRKNYFADHKELYGEVDQKKQFRQQYVAGSFQTVKAVQIASNFFVFWCRVKPEREVLFKTNNIPLPPDWLYYDMTCDAGLDLWWGRIDETGTGVC